MSQPPSVCQVVSCPKCGVKVGQYCVYRTGPHERIGKPTKDCHPERIAALPALVPPAAEPSRDEAITASLTSFVTQNPQAPVCGLAWRAAFAAGELHAKGGSGPTCRLCGGLLSAHNRSCQEPLND